jgi:hypothetical protein
MRGARRNAPIQLPPGVKLAEWVPILVIPSGGHNPKGDGTYLAEQRRQVGNSKAETEVRLRYEPCCAEHKAAITVASLASEGELQALCTRLMQHHGHGRLMPDRAAIQWQECRETVACHDCLEEASQPQDAQPAEPAPALTAAGVPRKKPGPKPRQPKETPVQVVEAQ